MAGERRRAYVLEKAEIKKNLQRDDEEEEHARIVKVMGKRRRAFEDCNRL